MDEFPEDLKVFWLWMLEPPWRHSGSEDTEDAHLGWWQTGWLWSLCGVVLGAVFAPSLLQFMGLINTQYQDWLMIAIAVLTGFLVQLLAWFLFWLLFRAWHTWKHMPVLLFVCVGAIIYLLPLVGVGYGVYHYLAWVGTEQRSVTVAFVVSLLLKMFAIPLIKGIVTGALFGWLMKWLRGGKDTKKAG